jgi:phosphate-selective porin
LYFYILRYFNKIIVEKIFMVLNNFVKAACLSTCLGLASGSILANTNNVETNGGLHVYDSNDNDHWFNLNGKMRLDQTLSHNGNSDFQSSLSLRSLEATMKGGVGENLSYSFRLKNGKNVSMDKAQVTYSGFNSWSKVSVGQVSMPYGLGSTLAEDSLATQVFAPEANKDALGVSVTAWNDKVGLMCSVHQPSAAPLTSVAGFDTAARVSFAPLMRDNLILHVGANAYMQQNSNGFNSSLTNGGDNNVDLQMNGQKRGFGLDAAVLRGPLFMQAEFHQVSVGDDNASAMGYNVEASYAVTGETRDYNKVKGAFTQLNSENDGGSWQVSARHSGVHYQEDQHRTVGASVSWMANNNLTVLANYENVISADNNPGALTLRLQAAW